MTTKGQGQCHITCIILSNLNLNNKCESLLYCGLVGPVFQGFKIDYFSYRSRLNRICQGRQTSRDVTVCIVDTGTQNE